MKGTVKSNCILTINHNLDPPLSIEIGDTVYTKKPFKDGQMYYPRFTQGLILQTCIEKERKDKKEYETKAHLVKLQSHRGLVTSNLTLMEDDLIIEYNPIKHSQLFLVESFVEELPFLDVTYLKERAVTKKVVVRRSEVYCGSIKEYENAFPLYAVIENVIVGFIMEHQKHLIIPSKSDNTSYSEMRIQELMNTNNQTQMLECINEFTTDFAIKSGFYIDFSQL
ncbi:hypothetical protein ABC382_00840 [Lysinibacillus sp. 1P01SD]|uniref:hypothetical protein n=1 Tax=Lysinibacillus sp. 1P01SD TaxID=3132285 RepID=UPI00399F45DF